MITTEKTAELGIETTEDGFIPLTVMVNHSTDEKVLVDLKYIYDAWIADGWVEQGLADGLEVKHALGL
jgi:hypothetical protein